MDTTSRELLDLTQQLLDSIAAADWETYDRLCDPSLTAFEPEARGHLVAGMDFHRFYFDLGAGEHAKNVTISSPHVRLLGTNAAVVSYVRLIQHLGESGQPATSRFEETRVWQRAVASRSLPSLGERLSETNEAHKETPTNNCSPGLPVETTITSSLEVVFQTGVAAVQDQTAV